MGANILSRGTPGLATTFPWLPKMKTVIYLFQSLLENWQFNLILGRKFEYLIENGFTSRDGLKLQTVNNIFCYLQKLNKTK